jgi:hypothetical protein
MWKKNNPFKILLLFIFMVWQVSFYNTFGFLLPLSIVALILFLTYRWYNSFRFLLIFTIMWFEFYSPFFIGFYFFLFLSTSLFLYILIAKVFSTKSRFSLILLLLLTEAFYLPVNQIFIWIQNFFNQSNFAIKINTWVILRELIFYSLVILFINEIIIFIKKKFLISYE